VNTLQNVTPDESFLIEPEALLAAPNEAIVVDTRPARAYAAGHIPGAINLSTYDRFVAGTRFGELERFRIEMAALYGAAGLTRERPIVVYEDDTGMRAARELWILEYLGHAGAKMLHGGLKEWARAGGTLSTEPTALAGAQFAPGHVVELVIGCDEIIGQIRHPGRVLLDVRDADEFNGRDRTICCARRGHLPNAVWLEWTELKDPVSGRYKRPGDIRLALFQRGVGPVNEIVPYCHRGARSAHTYYALRYARHPRVRNYIGSWHDWSARTDLPVEMAK